MRYIQRSILLLICLTVLFACNTAQTQKKQSYETPPQVSKQSNNLFVIMVNKKYGFIDRTGKIVIEPQLEFANDFVESRAVIATRSPDFKLSYINEAGKVVGSPKFDNARNFSEGLAAIG